MIKLKPLHDSWNKDSNYLLFKDNKINILLLKNIKPVLCLNKLKIIN